MFAYLNAFIYVLMQEREHAKNSFADIPAAIMYVGNGELEPVMHIRKGYILPMNN